MAKGAKGGDATLPKEHYEKKQGEMGRESKIKYAEGLDNAGKLDKNSSALAGYVKSNKAKH